MEQCERRDAAAFLSPGFIGHALTVPATAIDPPPTPDATEQDLPLPSILDDSIDTMPLQDQIRFQETGGHGFLAPNTTP